MFFFYEKVNKKKNMFKVRYRYMKIHKGSE
jgi:hypothetical protein